MAFIRWAFSLLLLAQACQAIWPQPQEFDAGSDVLWLDPHVRVTLHCSQKDGMHEYSLTPPTLHQLYIQARRVSQSFFSRLQINVDDDVNNAVTLSDSEDSFLRDAVLDSIKTIRTSKFRPWKLHKRGSRFEPESNASRRQISRIDLHQRHCPSERTFDATTFFGGDESYEVNIEGDGTASIRTNSSIGTTRGLQTLQQLFFAHSTLSASYTPYVPLKINDRPVWRHRGLSLDIARNPFTVEDMLRTIDAMSTVKLNRLHLHATDSQSWPLEIPSLPDLARRGAYQPHLVLTAKDLLRIQVHGASRGVAVFAELDMPGHTASVAHAYPGLVAAFNELDWSTFAAEPLSGQLKLNSHEVDEFVATVLNDLLSRMAPYTSLYHVGGDEVNLAAYLLDETVKTNDASVLQPFLQRFIDKIIDIIARHGLQPIVWEEMLLDWNLKLPSAADTKSSAPTLVQVWRNSERIEEVLKRGHRAIFGDYHHWYLDCGQGGFLDPYPTGQSPLGVPYNTSGGRPSQLKKPYLDYCQPYHNWRQIYTYDPLVNISQDLHDGIEGGEVLLWSEQTDSWDLDTKLWPRVAAAAEVLWSGVRSESMIADATRRLGEWRERAVANLKIHASPVTMTWCLMEGGCEL